MKRSERVLVFTDKPSPHEAVEPEDLTRRRNLRDISLITAELGRGIAKEIIFCEYPATCVHAKEPPKKLWELAFGKKAVSALRSEGLLAPILSKKADDLKLKNAEGIILKHKRHAVDAVIALSNYSTSHTAFRNLLTKVCGARYVSMPLFDVRMLEGAMAVDYKALGKRTRLIAREVGRADSIEIQTPNGTDISFSKKGRKAHADTGELARPGSFGNLPAGEVFLAPLEGTATGRLVLEWAPTRRLLSPVALTVRDGSVTGVSGREPFAGLLRDRL
ncbi:MAG: hypothetical protein Q8J64_07545, partial [Thermodesulfovibrionales bacterium]|nr:hypothetical protein [Thermodesulfovibrionales bacterium]